MYFCARCIPISIVEALPRLRGLKVMSRLMKVCRAKIVEALPRLRGLKVVATNGVEVGARIVEALPRLRGLKDFSL